MLGQCSFGVGRTLVRSSSEIGVKRSPRPLVGFRDKACADGVLAHVLEGRGQASVAVDDAGVEATAEEVAGAFVPAVEALCMNAAQVLDARREVPPRRLDDEVVVVAQQAEGEDAPMVPVDRLGEDAKERDAIDVVVEDGAAVDPACVDVEDAIRQVAATHARHHPKLSVADRREAARDTSGTLPLPFCAAAAPPRTG
jgi:hypothetical protein